MTYTEKNIDNKISLSDNHSIFSLQPSSVLMILIAIYMEAATKKLNNVYVILDGIVNKIVQVDYAIMTLTAITKKLVMVLFASVPMVGIGMHKEIAQVIISSINLASIIDPDLFSTFFLVRLGFILFTKIPLLN